VLCVAPAQSSASPASRKSELHPPLCRISSQAPADDPHCRSIVVNTSCGIVYVRAGPAHKWAFPPARSLENIKVKAPITRTSLA